MVQRATTFFILIALSAAAMALPTSDCSTPGDQANVVGETKALLLLVRESMDRQQVELDASIRAASARARWENQQQAQFLSTVLQRKTNTDFTKQIQLLTSEMRSILQGIQRDDAKHPDADCRTAARLRQFVEQLQTVYSRQTDYVKQALGRVKSKPGP